jgi:repressor LexA
MKEWPVLGAPACGKPLHRELLEETVMAPADIKADVVFRCVGHSMINARIFDGDAVFIHIQPEVENGQIAVVRIGDEYTLKRVYVYGDCVELRAENPTVRTITVRGAELDPDNFEIVGLAVAFFSTVF